MIDIPFSQVHGTGNASLDIVGRFDRFTRGFSASDSSTASFKTDVVLAANDTVPTHEREDQMTRRAYSVWSAVIVAVVMGVIATAHAQAPADFAGEPDKTMASAHDSFVKGDMNKAAEHIQKAAAYVRREGAKVAKDAKDGVMKAGDQLTKLGGEVKKGTVKSADQLKKTFAQVDHSLAKAWHATAEQTQKSGKDATGALKNAGASLEGAAKWSGTQLKEGAQASVDGLKKAGKGVKAGAEDVGKFFKGLGDGIADLGQKLGG
jgi:hypothetical protein